MKTLTTFLFVLLFATRMSAAALTLSGQVTDAISQQAVAGAIVSIPELRISVNTDENGRFLFQKIPTKGRFVLEVRFLGYSTFTQTVDLGETANLNIILSESLIEVHEVVVTGTVSGADNRRNSTAVTSISKEEMLNRPSNNIVDAISRVPGVSQITTGAAVSKPVIRGLSYNRVITLSDGVKQEGQQWGDEHGIEIDQYNTDRVEVLRGASSLIYGSDALGGVINILEPLPVAEGKIKGEVLSNYGSNNGLSGNSAMLQGNTKGFIWRARGTHKSAYAYKTPLGRASNSAFNETNYSAQIGLNKSWGYTHLNFSSFNTKLGIPGHGDHEEGEEEHEVSHANEFLSGNKSRKLNLPFQDINHYKLALNNQFVFNKGRLRSTLAFQDNQRRELEESTSDPSLFFDLKTYSYDFKYYFNNTEKWEPVIGVSGSFQNSKNKAEEILIPDYESQDIGGFAYIKRNWANTSINAGLRFDYRHFKGLEMPEDDEVLFGDFSNDFSNLSGAIGLTHNFNENITFKANAGSAFRAPNIAELSSNGVHEGTFRYEVGNTNLDPERSYYADAGLEFHNNKIDAHLNLFNNYIDNYIYYRQTANETIEAEERTLPVFRYVQDNANLYGLEAGLTLHPTSLIHFENTLSFTRGLNRFTKTSLPYMPAPVLRNELRLEPRLKSTTLKDTYFSIGIDNYLRQTKVDPNFETQTAGYTLLNASIGSRIRINKQAFKIYVTGDNLLDKEYVNHLNRLKAEGILNQGRNITFGVYIPLTIR
ncbi:TonB-dependent receptor [Desertivirga brevis]|uniref:TonB-dependent receptor n=1 Tax=Desertivirga brevis TaxID=2810310 RepID=UPI001A973BB1|nr:TonB-dependent receptor [Pedobacter sp. SYSU D00873]